MVGQNARIKRRSKEERKPSFADIIGKFLNADYKYVAPEEGEYRNCAMLARDICFAMGVEDKGEDGILAKILKEYLPIRASLSVEEKNAFIIAKMKGINKEVPFSEAIAGDILALEANERVLIAVYIGNGRALSLFTDVNGAVPFTIKNKHIIHTVQRIR